jgi:hypothetical protein
MPLENVVVGVAAQAVVDFLRDAKNWPDLTSLLSTGGAVWLNSYYIRPIVDKNLRKAMGAGMEEETVVWVVDFVSLAFSKVIFNLLALKFGARNLADDKSMSVKKQLENAVMDSFLINVTEGIWMTVFEK